MANASSEEQARQQGESDLLSIMLRIRDEGELDFPINTTNIKAVIVDLFTAGTETISTAAEWVMSELIRNPEIMAKVQAEIRQAFNNKDPHEHEAQMDNLRYTRMVIKETLRLHPPVQILLPRLCRATCDIGGFEIVKGTRVIVNSWAMSRSTKYWEDPEEFSPERFVNSVIDYRGAHFEYLPFGSGRRMCPGSGFGVATLESIVYYFDWSLPSGMRPEDLDMRTAIGASARRKIQLQLVASPYEVPVKI
ncbi:hypothetical protein EJB05_22404 [Eragrostis curvula]|uniref:Cytochrome P450 n=1 Tax=Eragrostis curvula TaxID=38414 RepID=A0A5J9V4D4_9POAL|nr:hypothetical protein EJB05_22403 [Eragrostis curvula]TVU30766.1 hypothetical protein EJB05_22404 [Eragrostis curvula]